MEIHITHVHIQGDASYRNIESVRWVDTTNAEHWDTDLVSTVVDRIKRAGLRAYVRTDWSRLDVVVVDGRYLCTEVHGRLTDHLIKLPHF